MTDKKLKPCPSEFQAVSDNMMEIHRLTAALDEQIQSTLATMEPAIALLQGDGMLIAEAHSKGILPLRKLALASSESRALHYGISEVLRKYGYELPVVRTRGPGGGR
jgi:hypothetical protein